MTVLRLEFVIHFKSMTSRSLAVAADQPCTPFGWQLVSKIRESFQRYRLVGLKGSRRASSSKLSQSPILTRLLRWLLRMPHGASSNDLPGDGRRPGESMLGQP